MKTVVRAVGLRLVLVVRAVNLRLVRTVVRAVGLPGDRLRYVLALYTDEQLCRTTTPNSRIVADAEHTQAVNIAAFGAFLRARPKVGRR